MKRRLVDGDYDSCYEECQKIENMEENGYVDAGSAIYACL